jgi:hypothetical protein
MSDVCRMTGSSNKTYTQPLADVFFHMQMSYSRYANKNHDDKKDEFCGDSRMNILRLRQIAALLVVFFKRWTFANK